ncbi:MAG: metallophosphoesterase [Myxococcales bacterium FL481]|nr:MAG: metallophosphoesterase [Myxococcales bacterium FL481]
MSRRVRTMVHLSDLHFGARRCTVDRVYGMVRRLVASKVDQVLVTGDITHRGYRHEFDAFRNLFEPLRDRLTIVPGNHDRLGDDAGNDMMPNERVRVELNAGMYLVRVDSTGPHNRFLLASHGQITSEDLDAIESALDAAPPHHLRVVMLHHHPVPLPEEQLCERLSTMIGWPYATELQTGRHLLERVAGRCDLVLHGHRHRPSHRVVGTTRGRVHVLNAGDSLTLGAARQFSYRGEELSLPPSWLPLGSARDQRGSSASPRATVAA